MTGPRRDFVITWRSTLHWSSCMSTRDSELEADTLERLVSERSKAQAAFAFSPLAHSPASSEEDRILEPDEIAAELVSDFDIRFLPPTPAQRRASAAHRGAAQPPTAPQPPLAATPVSRAHSEITLQASLQPPAAELAAAREEITRLRAQMRARDAYLKELERALDASTRQLEASGLGSVLDAYRLLGKVRGQAFRIAELESELRKAQQTPAPRKPPAKSKPRAPRGSRAAK
jgi:hypothetical protein